MKRKRRIILVSLLLLPFLVAAQSYTGVKNIKQSTRDYSEFGASYFQNGIIYCSNSRTNLISSQKSTDNQSFYNLYFVSVDKSKNKDFDILDTLLNKLYNEGPVSCIENMIAYGSSLGNKKHLRNKLLNIGIFFCQKNGEIWSQPIPFSYNNEAYNMGHPSLSSDGKSLYFASDMPGGLGQFDIYVSHFENGKWNTPTNLGDKINTPGSDLFPFIHSSGRLFYSTNYYDSVKTFDIYYSDFIDNQWTKPFRLGDPVNTKYNDFAFICDNTTENGYFSSDRKGTDDIYQFFSTLPEFETCDTMIVRNYCYHFEEGKTVDLDTIPGIYEWVFSDSTRIRSEQVDHCFSGPGLYNVQLNMIDTISGETNQQIANYELLVEDPIEPYITCSDTVKIGKEIEFDASQTNLPDKKLVQFVWVFSDNQKFLGKKISRSFEKPGIYKVNLGVTYDKDKAGNVQKSCVFKEIVVE